MEKQNEKEMEIAQFAWSLRWPTRRGRERKRTEAQNGNQDKVSLLGIRQEILRSSIRLPDSSIASWNRDLNFGVDCAIRARSHPRVGAQRNRLFSDQTVILKPIPAYRKHANRPREEEFPSVSSSLYIYSPFVHPFEPFDFSIFRARSPNTDEHSQTGMRERDALL